MSKTDGIDIPVSVTGAEEAKQKLGEVGGATKKMGDDVEHGSKKAGGGIKEFAASLAGTLGLTFSISAVIAGLIKLITFLDNVKTKIDENVKANQALRKSFEDVFDAMDAYTAKSQAAATKGAVQLAGKLGTETLDAAKISAVIERKYPDMPEQQKEALKETMLGGAITGIGVDATVGLLRMMPGFGVTDPKQMMAAQRQLRDLSKATRMDENEIISAVERAAPLGQSMGWTLGQTLEAVARVAKDVAPGRPMMKATGIFEAMATPEVKAAKSIGLTEEAKPEEYFPAYARWAQGKSYKEQAEKGRELWGPSGIYAPKLLVPSGMKATTEAEQAAKVEAFQETPTAILNKAAAAGDLYKLNVETDKQVKEAAARKIGEDALLTEEIENPYATGLVETFLPKEAEKEWAFKKQYLKMINKRLKGKASASEIGQAKDIFLMSGPEKQLQLYEEETERGSNTIDNSVSVNYYNNAGPQAGLQGRPVVTE